MRSRNASQKDNRLVCNIIILQNASVEVGVIFVYENENENGEKRENNEFVNENEN